MIDYGIEVRCCRIKVDRVVREISKMLHNMVMAEFGQDVYWGSKVAKIVLGDVGGN